MFCKAKQNKKVLYFSVFLLSLYQLTSRSLLPLLVCVELNVSSHKFELHDFRTFTLCLANPYCLTNSTAQRAQTLSVLFPRPTWIPPQYRFKSCCFSEMLLHSACFDGTVQLMLTTCPNMG